MPDALVNIGIKGQTPPPTYLDRLATNSLIEGAPSAAWWEKQSADVQFRFATAMRAGLALNETNQQLSQRVRGVMELSRRNAMALVRTSTQQVAADARRETFKRNDDVVAGIKHQSTFDERTTDICIAYGSDSADGDGAEWDLDLNPINGTKLPYDGGAPRHWQCRSVEVAITKSWDELGMPEMDEDYPEQAPGESFTDWLNSQSKDVQDEMLGEGRAQLWRDGKITLPQLLDQQGNALTLKELEAKYGAVEAVPKLIDFSKAETLDDVQKLFNDKYSKAEHKVLFDFKDEVPLNVATKLASTTDDLLTQYGDLSNLNGVMVMDRGNTDNWGEYFPYNKTIAFNSRALRNNFATAYEETTVPSIRSGSGLSYHPKAVDGMAEVITHEFGHSIYHYILDDLPAGTAYAEHVSASGLGLVKDMFREFLRSNYNAAREINPRPVSVYALYNENEWFAETLATMRTGTPESLNNQQVTYMRNLFNTVLNTKHWTDKINLITDMPIGPAREAARQALLDEVRDLGFTDLSRL